MKLGDYNSTFDMKRSTIRQVSEYKDKVDEMVRREHNAEVASRIHDIFYNGIHEGYSTEGRTCRDNSDLEFKRRMSLIKLANIDRVTFNQLIDNNINLFHGTNFNALPKILKYGMLSEKESSELGIEIETGEEYTRFEKVKRNFVSFTDQMEVALNYSRIAPSEKVKLPSFGIIIGLSAEDLSDLECYDVPSPLPELGVIGKVPTNRIKSICVPRGKEELVRRMVGNRHIDVLSLSDLAYHIEGQKYNEFREKDLDELAKKLANPSLKEKISKWWKNIINHIAIDKKIDKDR